MSTKDEAIFSEGETKKISQKEYEKSLEPYEQHLELLSDLEGWCLYAIGKLKESGYEGFVNYSSPSSLAWRPQAISPEASVEVKKADAVLRAIHNLREAIRQGDKNRVANAGIQVGIATSIAHADPYEVFAMRGIKSSDGHLHRDSTDRKDMFQEWLRENYDKIKDISYMPKLMKLERFRVLSEHVTEGTIRRWFKEVYPKHLKTGAPKKTNKGVVTP